jgi:hypothetical protein
MAIQTEKYPDHTRDKYDKPSVSKYRLSLCCDKFIDNAQDLDSFLRRMVLVISLVDTIRVMFDLESILHTQSYRMVEYTFLDDRSPAHIKKLIHNVLDYARIHCQFDLTKLSW